MLSKIQFGRIVVSEASPAVIIAEMACEHQGDLGAAKRLVELAKEAGADIVKFQLHLPDEEMIPGSIRFWAGSMDEILACVNLPPEAHQVLFEHSQAVGIQYLCTPFCSKAVDILDEMGVEAFKTGSGEMTNIPMLRHIARKGKPMIVSTGMATLQEIEDTVSALKHEGAQYMLMHCTSAYPPRYDQVNLGVIPRLKERFGCMVGHSDHTQDIWTVLGAVSLGAKVIEKHFTPDRSLKGPDHHVSLEPKEFRIMVEAIRKLEAALGNEKVIGKEEAVVREWAHHSVVSLRDIPQGALLTPELVGVKRPGSGVPAKFLEEFMGQVAKINIPANSLIRWDDVEKPIR